MAFSSKALFEVTVSNSVRNQTQNVAGKYGSFSGSTFTGADCDAGFLVVKNSLIPSEGYAGLTNPILNGNTWYFVTASNGKSGSLGDHTGIYACNTYDVNKVVGGGLSYNLGSKTLGLGVPANERGDFTEIIVGEQYTFGVDNFTSSTAPTSTNLYCTVANGKLTASSTAPSAGDGLYFKFLRAKAMTEGSTSAGTGYVLQACRA